MQAAFDPDSEPQTSIDLRPLSYDRIMALGFPFVPTRRVDVNQEGVDLWHEVETTAVKGGTPIVLDHWHKHPHWDPELFTFPFLNAKYGNDDVKMLMKEYIEEVHRDSLAPGPALAGTSNANGTSMGTPPSSGSKKSWGMRSRQQRMRPRQQDPLLYAKDLTCPEDWRNYLMDDLLPLFLGYMCENDLNNLNTKVAAENLMIYIGQAGTWTPAHMDQCGAIGHNIMTWADDDSSSIWFMVRTEDKKKAEALWQRCGHPLEYEGYFASVEELQQADFPIYVAEQKIGDFVMVPSMGYHQVVNLGKASIKVAWNRLTAHCLKAAVNVVLPRYREVMRPEGYRIKTIIQSALQAWTTLLESQSEEFPVSKENFCESYKDILTLFRTIVEEEWVDLDALKLSEIMDEDGVVMFHKPKRLTNTEPAVCDFCSSDIWSRQFQCVKCAEDGDSYDLCTRCFALGRGCRHRSSTIEFVESFSMRSSRTLYSNAVRAWNTSHALEGCQAHETMVDEWINGIVPPKDKEPSYTSLAYLRQESLKARGKDMSLEHVDQKPPPPSLKFTRPDEDPRNWGSVADAMKWSFAPYREDGNADEGTDRSDDGYDDTDSEEEKEEEEDENMSQNEKGLLIQGRSRDIEGGSAKEMSKVQTTSVQPMRVAKNSRKRDAAVTKTVTTTVKKKTRLSTPAALGCERTPSSSSLASLPSSSSSSSRTNGHDDSQHDQSIWMTADMFINLIGEEEEWALLYAKSNGLSRTLQMFTKEQEKNAGNQYYADLFRMDEVCARRGAEFRDSFRQDIIEKYGIATPAKQFADGMKTLRE
ncbi:hypothetical protein BGZ58_006030 [Dissophora ornata]|nr:hypothetical protein BGZ58_006030 [Dissophora ornata]